MKQKIALSSLLLLMALCLPAAAIELSLEENRAERGSIGYVDMQRVFKLYPETLRAKEGFAETVRQAEEQINIRKTEILRLRSDLARLKMERDVLARSTPTLAGIGTEAASSIATGTATAASGSGISTATSPGIAAGTTTALSGNGIFSLPGFDATSNTSTATPLGIATGTVTASSRTATETPSVLQAPQPQKPPWTPPSASATELQALDEKITQAARKLSQKEAEAREHRAAAEKNILDLESRKSEILLGKIHKVVQEVARKEGVSVVVDKGSILYGHNAVDLTEKVLKLLKGG